MLGTVGKPFGLAGDVYLWVDPDLRDALVPGLRCTVGERTLEIVAIRWHKGRAVIRLAGIVDRAAIAELRGAALEVDRRDVTSDGMIWTDDVLGREVVDASGEVVGVVDGVLDGAAHDFLSVARPDGGELLVPVVDELVDLDDPVVVHGPPGLLDPADAIE
jgi:16S rRNA processing protein RimM